MLRFAPYILKSLWRHRRRSLLTASGAAVALFVFVIVGAVQQGLDGLASDAQSGRVLIVFQENRFCPMSSRLPEDYARSIAAMEGVERVVPMQVYTNNCRASLDAVVFQGMPAPTLRTARNLELAQGSWDAFERSSDAALVGRSVASRRGIRVGQVFALGPIRVQVAGIFRSAVPAEDNLVFTHLDFLQRTPGLNLVGLATQFEVWVAPGASPEGVARRVDEHLRSGPVPTTTRRKGAFQANSLADLVDLVRLIEWLGLASVGLVLSLVATTAVMAVEDRLDEYAVLQVIGARPGRAFRLVVAESLLLCLAGGATGTLAAIGYLGASGLALGAEGVTLSFQPSWGLAARGLAAAAVVGLAGGALPGWRAASASLTSPGK